MFQIVVSSLCLLSPFSRVFLCLQRMVKFPDVDLAVSGPSPGIYIYGLVVEPAVLPSHSYSTDLHGGENCRCRLQVTIWPHQSFLGPKSYQIREYWFSWICPGCMVCIKLIDWIRQGHPGHGVTRSTCRTWSHLFTCLVSGPFPCLREDPRLYDQVSSRHFHIPDLP